MRAEEEKSKGHLDRPINKREKVRKEETKFLPFAFLVREGGHRKRPRVPQIYEQTMNCDKSLTIFTMLLLTDYSQNCYSLSLD